MSGVYVPGPTFADMQAVVPSAALVAPPAVADAGVAGGQQSYARADHTHASKGRKERKAVTTEIVTWVYPNTFDAGVVLICNAIAEVALGSTELVNAQVYGVPTNTQCQFQITRIARSVVGVVANVLSINSTPFAGFIHMRAEAP